MLAPAPYRALPVTEILLGAVVFVSACLSIWLTRVPGGLTLFWPVTGMAAALLIRLPSVRWVSAAVCILLGIVLANMLALHRPWPTALAFGCINGAEIALMVAAFRFVWRFPYPDITINQAVLMTAVAGVAVPGLVALAAAPLRQAVLGLPFTEVVELWWSSHAVGACLVGPPIVLFSAARWHRLVRRPHLLENAATLALVLVGTCLLIRYVRFPFVGIGCLLLIGAFRLEGFGASVAGLLVGLLIMSLWLMGIRPVGLEAAPAAGTLMDLPALAFLAAVMPPIAVGIGTAARRITVRALRMSERRFRESIAHSPIGMLIADMNGTWTYANVALQKMLGYSAEELRALPPGGPSDPDEWEESKARWKPLISGTSDFYETDRRFRHKDGHWVWTHVAVSLLRNEDGSPQHLLAQIESLEARLNAETALAEERERLRVTVNSISDAVVTLDADMRIDFINESAQRLLGLDADAARRRRFDEVVHLTDPLTSRSVVSLATLSALHGRVQRRESPCVLHRPDGLTSYVIDSASPVLDSSGHVTGIVLALRDATADVERTRELRHRATYDPLTGLVNRSEFQQRLRDTYRKARHLDRPAALLAIDLDRFKGVNDAAGHAAGDAMLRQVADVCRMHVRASDTVARLGGDEFAIILDNCRSSYLETVCQKILQALNPLEIEWEGARRVVGASIGVATITPEMGSESDWMEAADKACYQAKSGGRGEMRFARSQSAR
ncbi:MAG TPA: diguanylate cyclase [Steroidobacteraceae bacterium]|nr:diguanylate cyclase [Steroidobacteraceae bacterium]